MRTLRGVYIHATAHVHPSAKLAAGVTVNAGAYVGPRAVLGPGCSAGAGVHIGAATTLVAQVSLENCSVGRHCLIHPGVRVGADGFGFTVESGAVRKKPQLLRVLIGDHVEIGANTCIDRGSWRDTAIGSHTKMDNMVQVRLAAANRIPGLRTRELAS